MQRKVINTTPAPHIVSITDVEIQYYMYENVVYTATDGSQMLSQELVPDPKEKYNIFLMNISSIWVRTLKSALSTINGLLQLK